MTGAGGWEGYEATPAWQTLGLRVIDAGGGTCRLRMATAPMMNKQGLVHGGAVAALADAAMGVAIRSAVEPGSITRTIEFKVNFLAPACGDQLVGVGRLVRLGKSTAVATADIFEAEDAPAVAFAVGTFAVRPPRERGG